MEIDSLTTLEEKSMTSVSLDWNKCLEAVEALKKNKTKLFFPPSKFF